jgi:hypothetical protein
VFASLTPWLTNLELDKKWAGTSTEALLTALYTVTERHGLVHPDEVKQLWCTVSEKPANISAVLDFVLHRVVSDFQSEPGSAAKV